MAGEIDRCLSAELDNRRRYVVGCRWSIVVREVSLIVEDVAHRLFIEWLEVEAIAGVEVRRYGFGIGVGHDGAVAGAIERPRRMHRAVVELDPLSDADRAAA